MTVCQWPPLLLLAGLLSFATAQDSGASCTAGNGACGEGNFCLLNAGRCDAPGTCAVLPAFCILDFDPVCGCDGEDYSNECDANLAGISVAGEGECDLLENVPTLLVEEGFESGVLSDLLFNPSGNTPEVLHTDDARAGAHVMKSELNQGSDVSYRTEVSVKKNIVNFDVGEEYWTGISVKLGDDFRDRPDFNDQGMVFQFHYRGWLHPEVRDAQPLLLRFKEDEVHVHNEVLQEYMASVPPAYGEWVDWVMHVKFDDVDGVIQIWRNGELLVDWTGDNHQREMIEGAYLKFGLYSSQYQDPPGVDFVRTVYHDELRIAGADGSYEMVAPPRTPAVVIAHPQPATVVAGDSAVFRVTANGAPPLSYQWYVNGVVSVPARFGGQAATFDTPSALPNWSGVTVHCDVSNPLGTISSESATLTVVP